MFQEIETFQMIFYSGKLVIVSVMPVLFLIGLILVSINLWYLFIWTLVKIQEPSKDFHLVATPATTKPLSISGPRVVTLHLEQIVQWQPQYQCHTVDQENRLLTVNLIMT